jgi:hypothetical protein
VDIYDLLYAILIARDYPVARLEVVSTFLKKSIFEPQPNLAKEQLLAIPLGAFEGIWPSLIVPTAALMAFSFVSANFHSLVDSLFALIVPAAVALPTAVRPLGRGGFPGRLPGLGGVSPLRANTRQTLVTAAHNQHMVEMIYDGYTRLVEPYKLEYYVRRSDGHGSEYFWGWDTSGGKSGKVGIKQFFCHKIASATESARTYVPRFPVQL